MNIWLLGALAIVVAAVLWYIMTMNRFARLLVKIREADSGIEVALTKRFDTLTKMLEVTRAYARACLQTSYRSQISEAARHTKAAKTSASLS